MSRKTRKIINAKSRNKGYMVQILELKRQIEELLRDKEDLSLRLTKREEDYLFKSISV